MIDKLKESLLLNAYSVEPLGYFRGKAGVALTLFELARRLGDESLEEHGFELLQQVLAYGLDTNDFPGGKAGVAYVLQYLIANRLVDADYRELYGEQHDGIVGEIAAPQGAKNSKGSKSPKKPKGDKGGKGETSGPSPQKLVYDLLFVRSLGELIPRKEYYRCLNALSSGICRDLNSTRRKVGVETGTMFYSYAARLLNVCSAATVPNEVTGRILDHVEDVVHKLSSLDCVCAEPTFPIYWLLCALKVDKPDSAADAGEMVRVAMKNLLVQTLDFRHKTDLAMGIFRLWGADPDLDYRDVADRIMGTLTDEDIAQLEQKVYDNIFCGASEKSEDREQPPARAAANTIAKNFSFADISMSPALNIFFRYCIAGLFRTGGTGKNPVEQAAGAGRGRTLGRRLPIDHPLPQIVFRVGRGHPQFHLHLVGQGKGGRAADDGQGLVALFPGGNQGRTVVDIGRRAPAVAGQVQVVIGPQFIDVHPAGDHHQTAQNPAPAVGEAVLLAETEVGRVGHVAEFGKTFLVAVHRRGGEGGGDLFDAAGKARQGEHQNGYGYYFTHSNSTLSSYFQFLTSRPNPHQSPHCGEDAKHPAGAGLRLAKSCG